MEVPWISGMNFAAVEKPGDFPPTPPVSNGDQERSSRPRPVRHGRELLQQRAEAAKPGAGVPHQVTAVKGQ